MSQRSRAHPWFRPVRSQAQLEADFAEEDQFLNHSYGFSDGFDWYRLDPEYQDVREFQRKFGIPTANAPRHLSKRLLDERIGYLIEELKEFIEGCDAQDLAAQADALIDLVYFAKGAAAMMGLPWAVLWDDVHRANMEKERGDKKRGFTCQFDMIKPSNWQPPRTLDILHRYGYRIEKRLKPYDCD